jgi:lysophospholipase L1-like esterase
MKSTNQHHEYCQPRWKQAAMLLFLTAVPLCGCTGANAMPLTPQNSRYLARPANSALPTLFIIGDSTVRNGNGTGHGGQWGWGDCLAPFFETNRLNVVNDALGGTSSRTFYRDRWPRVLAMMKPGDFLIMQFGHNDSSPVNETVPDSHARSRGTIKGVGAATLAITNILTRKPEIVHTFGWYEETIISEAKAKGVTPMVCSLIPRNNWKHGRALRNKSDYAGWAATVAKTEKVPFLDLNEIIARRYDELGQAAVNLLFVVGAGPHTSRAGAETNALCVVSALKGLPTNPLARFFSEKADGVTPADLNRPAPVVSAPGQNTPE